MTTSAKNRSQSNYFSTPASEFGLGKSSNSTLSSGPPPGTPDYHLSFSGCGFQGLYHIGVASCIQKHAPYLFNGKVAGCSAGGLIAACAVCDCKLEHATNWSLDLVRKARSRTFGPFHPSFDLIGLLRKGIDQFLPQDAHIKCTGRLHLSLTTLPDRKNVVVSKFSTRQELINALVCTCWIPIFAGIIPPTFEGKRYIDGGFTCNLLSLDDNTITVAPFSGAADIAPTDDNHTFNYIYVTNLRMELTAENVARFTRIFYPPNTNGVLEGLCKRGYNDAFVYLQKHKLMSCNRCLSSCATLFNLAKFPRRQTSEKLRRQLAPSAKSIEVAPVAFTRKRTNSKEQIYSKEPKSLGKLKRSFSTVSAISATSGKSDDDNYCENCPECQRLKDVQNAILPEQIVTLLQNFTMNESLYNRICSYKAVQFLGAVTLPIRLPLEAFYFTAKKLYEWLPDVSDDFNWFICFLNSAFQEVIEKTGVDFCFARLHLELVDVWAEPQITTRRQPMSRQMSFCSLHSNAASRRSSISFEPIDNNSNHFSSRDDVTDLHVSPHRESRRIAIDFKIGVRNFNGHLGDSRDDLMDSGSYYLCGDESSNTAAIANEAYTDSESENAFDQSDDDFGGDCEDDDEDDLIFFGSNQEPEETTSTLNEQPETERLEACQRSEILPNNADLNSNTASLYEVVENNEVNSNEASCLPLADGQFNSEVSENRETTEEENIDETKQISTSVYEVLDASNEFDANDVENNLVSVEDSELEPQCTSSDEVGVNDVSLENQLDSQSSQKCETVGVEEKVDFDQESQITTSLYQVVDHNNDVSETSQNCEEIDSRNQNMSSFYEVINEHEMETGQ